MRINRILLLNGSSIKVTLDEVNRLGDERKISFIGSGQYGLDYVFEYCSLDSKVDEELLAIDGV